MMAALPTDILTPAEIAADPALRRGLATLRARKRLDLGPCGPIVFGPAPALRIVHQLGDRDIPYPPALRPLLRREWPERHWALILASVFGHDDGPARPPERLAAMWTLRRIVERDAASDRAVPCIRMLVPVAACAHCGGEFLRETARKRYCSDRCRRETEHAKERERKEAVA